jgi:hypothetical protein
MYDPFIVQLPRSQIKPRKVEIYKTPKFPNFIHISNAKINTTIRAFSEIVQD